jgi:hypothetical protein
LEDVSALAPLLPPAERIEPSLDEGARRAQREAWRAFARWAFASPA